MVSIYAYKNTSRGANLLKDLLKCKLIKHEGSTFKGDKKKVVLNWGASEIPKEVRKCKMINNSDSVECIVDRQNMLRSLSTKFDVPAFTSDVEHAAMWIDAGTEVFEKGGVFTMDVKPSATFRVHQFPGKSVYIQFKDKQVVEKIPEATRTLIKETCEEVRQFLGLDFCAITVAWNDFSSRHYILNVNTAPELTPELAEIYANNIKELV